MGMLFVFNCGLFEELLTNGYYFHLNENNSQVFIDSDSQHAILKSVSQ